MEKKRKEVKYYTKKLFFYENLNKKARQKFSYLVSDDYIKNNTYKYLKILFLEIIWNVKGIIIKFNGKIIFKR